MTFRTFNTFKTFRTLLKNELKMSFRGMDMLIFAVIMPLAVLVILGLVFGQKPAFEGAPYTFLEQSFGALCTISICAERRGYSVLKRQRRRVLS